MPICLENEQTQKLVIANRLRVLKGRNVGRKTIHPTDVDRSRRIACACRRVDRKQSVRDLQQFSEYVAGRNEQCDALHFWSNPSGGANFAMADGLVRLIAYTIGDNVMQALATRAGVETVTLPQ